MSILKTRFTVRMVPGCFRLTLLHLVINFSFLCSSELILAGIHRRNKPLMKLYSEEPRELGDNLYTV